jgi:transcriptional regulator with XRE-family HTH domain
MSKRVKRKDQNVMDWLDELVVSDPEAQAAYEDETLRLRLADALRKAREEAGMTQTMVAEEMGVRQSLISKLERPDHNHTVETALAYLQAVGANLVVAVVTADGQDLIPASTLAENVVLLPKFVSEEAEARGLSLREHVLCSLAHQETAREMTRVFRTELKVHISELQGELKPQQPQSGRVRQNPVLHRFAEKADAASLAA